MVSVALAARRVRARIEGDGFHIGIGTTTEGAVKGADRTRVHHGICCGCGCEDGRLIVGGADRWKCWWWGSMMEAAFGYCLLSIVVIKE